MAIPNENLSGFALGDISEALTQAEAIDRALEVGMMIPNEKQREAALRDVANSQ